MKRRVMIVDDVADIRMMLRYIIERGDYVVVAEAANGVEAVEMYREHQPDITVMDIEMPLKSGVEAAREIRALAGDARIIFCSGGVGKCDVVPEDIRTYGNSVVRKPFLPAQLYQALAV